MSVLLPLCLLIANVMGAGMIVPQVIHLHRHRTGEGLSATWVGVGIVMNLWWILYALKLELWGILPVSVMGAVLYLVLAVQLHRIERQSPKRTQILRRLANGVLGIGWVPLVGLLAGGWGAAGLAIGVCYGIQFAPAAFTAVRSSDLSGLSPVTWAMAWIEAVIWLAYGLLIGDPALLVGGAGGTVMASVILLRFVMPGRPVGDRRGPFSSAQA